MGGSTDQQQTVMGFAALNPSYELRFARNDIVSACHCEKHSDEAISVKVRTGGKSSVWFAPLAPDAPRWDAVGEGKII